MSGLDEWTVSDLFDDIIQGRGVKRSIHGLEYDHILYSELFIERLQLFKYRPMTLGNITLDESYKAPAFFIHKNHALFGYVMWRTDDRNRKIKVWASAARNAEGESKYILPDSRDVIVFVNLGLAARLEE